MVQKPAHGAQRKFSGSGDHAKRDSGELTRPTAGGPPDLPGWLRERQLDLFGLPPLQASEDSGHN